VREGWVYRKGKTGWPILGLAMRSPWSEPGGYFSCFISSVQGQFLTIPTH